MRRVIVVLAALLLLFPFLPLFHTEDADHAFMASNFGYNDEKTRLEYRLAMIAAGHSREIAGPHFTRALFDEVKAFQRGIGEEATGATTQAQIDRVFAKALPVLEGWALRSLRHPARGHAIWVPTGLVLEAEPLPDGIFVRDREDRIHLSFVHFADDHQLEVLQVGALEIGEQPGWVIAEDYFIIDTTLDGYRRHLHFHRDAGGLTGIDISWNGDDPPVYGERLAVAISSSLFAAMTGAPLLEMEPVEFAEDAWPPAVGEAAPI